MMNRISLIYQEGALKSYFPDSQITRTREERLTWIHTITPSPVSSSYKVKLEYVRNNGIKFYVLEPKLELTRGATALPHVFSTPEQRLCLFTASKGEWHVGMWYVHTIIPWACEWLYHYEVWVVTGKWNGGGTQPQIEGEKINQANETDSPA
ncbi:MAG: hypothetical protein HY707_06125 [Ignavibacteriae bacterium]|nr:hypothetical protein [Ignavibacteriota bacterium]